MLSGASIHSSGALVAAPGGARAVGEPSSAPNVLDPVDAAMLAAVQAALATPFADPVLLQGAGPVRAIPRRDARAMERMLLKLKKLGGGVHAA